MKYSFFIHNASIFLPTQVKGKLRYQFPLNFFLLFDIPLIANDSIYRSSLAEELNASVFISDPQKTLQGMLSFEAYRLTPLLLELYGSGEKAFTPEGYVLFEMV